MFLPVDVAAAPLRVRLLCSPVASSPSPAHIRWGLAAEPIAPVLDNTHAVYRMNHGKPCSRRMSRFKKKSIEISNAFRQALGWPLIESHIVIFEHTSMFPLYPFNEKIPVDVEVKPAEVAPEAK